LVELRLQEKEGEFALPTAAASNFSNNENEMMKMDETLASYW
jgi:hypothetical protein